MATNTVTNLHTNEVTNTISCPLSPIEPIFVTDVLKILLLFIKEQKLTALLFVGLIIGTKYAMFNVQ